MSRLSVKMVAFANAGKSVFDAGKEALYKILEPEFLTFDEPETDIIYFLSGGSEQAAIKDIHPTKLYFLLTSVEQNAHASAMEVKAYLGNHGIQSVILDINDRMTVEKLRLLLEVKQSLNSLHGQRLGLVGHVSDWLIASTIRADILKDKLGIVLVTTPWDNLQSFNAFPLSRGFLQLFQDYDQSELEQASRVYGLLRSHTEAKRLDAITVECFSLVNQHSVSGCLALAKFNNDGFPAGCEGDIASITGMMFIKSLCGQIPWMANVVGFEKNTVLLAHCTVSPDLIDTCHITTHFETKVGTAIQGQFIADEVTVFRFSDTLDRAFLATGTVINRPQYQYACRTQIELEMFKDSIDLMKTNPLGNHHLVLPGIQLEKIRLACRIAGIEVLE